MRADVMIKNGLTRRLMRLEAERFVAADGVDALLSQPSIGFAFRFVTIRGRAASIVCFSESTKEVIIDDAAFLSLRNYSMI